MSLAICKKSDISGVNNRTMSHNLNQLPGVLLYSYSELDVVG